jgi:hypothetical protein
VSDSWGDVMQFRAMHHSLFFTTIPLLLAISTGASGQSFSHFGRYEPDPNARTGSFFYNVYVTSRASNRLVCNARANVTTWNRDMGADGEGGLQRKTEERGTNRVEPGQTSLVVSVSAVAVQDGAYSVNCQPDPLAQQSAPQAGGYSGVDLARHCRSHGYAGVVNLDNTGYGWRCAPGNASISVDSACQEQYGAGFRAKLKSPPPGRAEDWICSQ